MKWYVVQAYSGYENKVKKNLEHRIESLAMQNKIFEVVVPNEEEIELKDAYEVSAPSIDTEARLLSGGNLQRLILAREISSEPGLMVAVQPTRGLDVGAAEGLHRELAALRDAGIEPSAYNLESIADLYAFDRLY